MKELKLLVVGGCAEKQYKLAENINISESDNFLILLKDTLLKEQKIDLQIKHVSWERYFDTPSRTIRYDQDFDADMIYVRLRGIQHVRLSYLYYYYASDEDNIHSTFNIPLVRDFQNEVFRPEILNAYHTKNNRTEVEVIDDFKDDTDIKPERKTGKINSLLFNLRNNIVTDTINYGLGQLIGNRYFANKLYFKMIDELIEYAETNNKKIFFMGIFPRKNHIWENTISRILNKNSSKHITNKGYEYIDLFDELDNNLDKYFLSDKVHINQVAHKLFASKLYKTILRMVK